MKGIRWLALVALAAACSDDPPANVAGTYTLRFTPGDNGCNLDGWTAGMTGGDVELDLSQAVGSADIDGEVKNWVGVYVAILFGTAKFQGRVSGDTLDVILNSQYGDLTQGQCKYSYQLHMGGTLSGDILTGTLDITTVTNHSLDCGTRENCHSLESFNGLRPPT